MEPVRRIAGRMAPLDRANVDTDQIMPKQFLKRIERSGFGPFIFYDWRRAGGFVLDQPEYQGAAVLVAGPNFGCGSSREHAAWGLQDAGFRAVIAPSFSDIFRSNSLKIGMLPVELPETAVRALLELAGRTPATEVVIDLEEQSVSAGPVRARFAIDPFARECLLNGWDEIALTLLHHVAISAFESRRPSFLPRVADSAGL
jgi:3-isopropylmalate/(R)-2-methylmalate dehydratase small subunit